MNHESRAKPQASKLYHSSAELEWLLSSLVTFAWVNILSSSSKLDSKLESGVTVVKEKNLCWFSDPLVLRIKD